MTDERKPGLQVDQGLPRAQRLALLPGSVVIATVLVVLSHWIAPTDKFGFPVGDGSTMLSAAAFATMAAAFMLSLGRWTSIGQVLLSVVSGVLAALLATAVLEVVVWVLRLSLVA